MPRITRALTGPGLRGVQRDRAGFSFEKALETPEASVAIVGVLTILAFALRFYKINHPDQVV